jgi:hypothetical protein
MALVGLWQPGTGACREAPAGQSPVKLVALGDLIPSGWNKPQESHKYADLKPKIDVPAERMFAGFDGLPEGCSPRVDLRPLRTPPHSGR